MDEIEAVSTLRTDPVPAPETVARHRNQLLSAIASASNGEAQRSAEPDTTGGGEVFDLTLGRAVVAPEPPRSSRRRWLVVGAAAAAVVAVVAVGTVLATREDDADFAAVTEEEATESGQLACGNELPFAIELSSFDNGPIAGPIDPAMVVESGSTGPDQLVQHWDGPTGQLELRWPARSTEPTDPIDPAGDDLADPATVETDADGVSEAANVGWVVIDPLPTPSEASVSSAGYAGIVESPLLGEGPCGQLGVTVTGPDEQAAGLSFDEVVTYLQTQIARAAVESAAEAERVEPTPPLVVGQSEETALPAIGECDVPEGEPAVPNVAEAVEGLGTFATPEEALAVFLASQGTLLQDGYVQYDLADGTIGYVRTTEWGKVVTIVHAQPVEDGWTITDWQATGC